MRERKRERERKRDTDSGGIDTGKRKGPGERQTEELNTQERDRGEKEKNVKESVREERVIHSSDRIVRVGRRKSVERWVKETEAEDGTIE